METLLGWSDDERHSGLTDREIMRSWNRKLRTMSYALESRKISRLPDPLRRVFAR